MLLTFKCSFFGDANYWAWHSSFKLDAAIKTCGGDNKLSHEGGTVAVSGACLAATRKLVEK